MEPLLKKRLRPTGAAAASAAGGRGGASAAASRATIRNPVVNSPSVNGRRDMVSLPGWRGPGLVPRGSAHRPGDIVAASLLPLHPEQILSWRIPPAPGANGELPARTAP